jgi:hypothetical protein
MGCLKDYLAVDSSKRKVFIPVQIDQKAWDKE